MKGGKTPLGYTIVEVMIVLAVSGMMLVIAGQFIQGKQARTAFTQGVNEMASRLQTTINEVVNGQYTDIQLYCTMNYNALDPNRNSISVSTTPPAVNKKNCTYVGKFLHFVQAGRPSGDAEAQYEVFTLAAGRLDNSSPPKPITNLAYSGVGPVIDLTSSPANLMLTRQETTPFNLLVRRMEVDGSTTRYGIGFIQELGSDNGTGSGYKNGPQTVRLYSAVPLTRDQTTEQAATRIKPPSGALATGLQPTKRAVICLSDGNRFAELIVGDNGNALSVNVNMRGTDSCA